MALQPLTSELDAVPDSGLVKPSQGILVVCIGRDEPTILDVEAQSAK